MPTATICIIEDDASLRAALVRLCRSAGLDALGFASADDFLAAPIPAHTSCIVSDIVMPGTLGTRLPALLDQRGIRLPVILITGHDSPQTREQAHRSGAASYFRKPIDDQALLDAISWASYPAA